MLFKKNLIWTAMLLSGVSLQSWALTPAQMPSTGPDIALYIPGSQANDPDFGFPFNGSSPLNALCLTNPETSGTSAHVYFFNESTTPSNPLTADNNYNSAIFCLTDNTKIPGLQGGTGNTHQQTLLISRRRLGASFVGLDAVQNGTTLTYLSTNDITKNCAPNTGAGYSSGGVTYNYDYSCSTVTAGITATAATSDITPDVFYGSDNIPPVNNYSAIDPTQIANIYPIAGEIVGIPVTLNLRNALQLAEAQSGLLPATCTPGTETAACVPTLTKAQLVSLFSGNTSSWSSFYINGIDLVTLANNYAKANTTQTAVKAPSDSTVHICRRENGAGQQVAVLANILQDPCLGTAAPSLAQPGGASDVVYATSLGAVDNCLTDYYNTYTTTGGVTTPAYKFFGTTTNLSSTGYAPNPPKTTAGNQWAIGIQTTERNPSNTSPYRFIAIDNAVATGYEAAAGHYPLVAEYAISYQTPASTNVSLALQALVNYSQLPATVAARNNALSNQTSFGQAGYVALSGYTINGQTNAPSIPWNASSPVTPYTHDASGAPNACSIPVINPDFNQVNLQ
jgi:hypothetical protein